MILPVSLTRHPSSSRAQTPAGYITIHILSFTHFTHICTPTKNERVSQNVILTFVRGVLTAEGKPVTANEAEAASAETVIPTDTTRPNSVSSNETNVAAAIPLSPASNANNVEPEITSNEGKIVNNVDAQIDNTIEPEIVNSNNVDPEIVNIVQSEISCGNRDESTEIDNNRAPTEIDSKTEGGGIGHVDDESANSHGNVESDVEESPGNEDNELKMMKAHKSAGKLENFFRVGKQKDKGMYMNN